LCSGVAAKVTPGKVAATHPPPVPKVSGFRQRFRWKWVSVPAIAVLLGLLIFWVWAGNGDKSHGVDLADLVAGVYHGDVVSDAKGSSVSDVTLTITKLSQRKVRVSSDYKRLGVAEIELNRVGNTIQSIGGRSLLLLEMDKNPPRLSFNPDGNVAYVGQR
jgi:hypothetical protein